MIPPINRRAFLSGASVAGLGLATGCTPNSTSQGETVAIETPAYTEFLGVQLYTVRELFEADAQSTLEALAEIGVKDCQTAGLFDYDPKDIRAIMDDSGLISRSGHIRLPQVKEGIHAEFETAQILGQTALYLGWIPEEERTLERYRILADLLNERGMEAKEAGLKFGYHNHDFEFIEDEGTTGYDILLERTDPDFVTMELDFYWTAQAKVDPLELFSRAPNRFSSCHIKDRDAGGNMVPVGDGEIDFATILEAASEVGIERFYVEHDDAAEPLGSVARSFTHLLQK